MSYERLKAAPIVEAVINIWVDLPVGIGVDELRSMPPLLGDDYDRVEMQTQVVHRIDVGPDGTQTSNTQPQVRGLLCRSMDGLRIAQIRLDGFSFNRLSPYDRWETFVGEARDKWEKYVTVARPIRVPRLTLRFINRIDLPPNPGDLKRYFRTTPELGPGIPQALSSYMMRLVVPMDGLTQGLITQGLEKPTPDGRVPVVLDLEVRHERAFEPQDAAMWAAFELMRGYKNQLFFESITREVEDWYR